jgi:hypothetical protein
MTRPPSKSRARPSWARSATRSPSWYRGSSWSKVSALAPNDQRVSREKKGRAASSSVRRPSLRSAKEAAALHARSRHSRVAHGEERLVAVDVGAPLDLEAQASPEEVALRDTDFPDGAVADLSEAELGRRRPLLAGRDDDIHGARLAALSGDGLDPASRQEARRAQVALGLGQRLGVRAFADVDEEQLAPDDVLAGADVQRSARRTARRASPSAALPKMRAARPARVRSGRSSWRRPGRRGRPRARAGPGPRPARHTMRPLAPCRQRHSGRGGLLDGHPSARYLLVP